MERKRGKRPASVKEPIEPVVEIPVVTRKAAPIQKTPKRTIYHIANTTMADVVYPRPGNGGLKATCIIFPAGQSVPVDAEEWKRIRVGSGMRNYLNHGLLRETNRDGEVSILTEASANLIIPEHLRTESEIEGSTGVKASVRKKTVTKMEV